VVLKVLLRESISPVNLLALLGAIFSGAYLMVGRSVRNRLSLAVYTTIVYGVASIVLIMLVIFSGAKVTGYSSNMYWWVIGMALIPQVIGHTTFNWALKYLSAAYVSIALLGEPIGAVILAALLLKEKPGILEIVGGILILLGIILATQRALYKKILLYEPGGDTSLTKIQIIELFYSIEQIRGQILWFEPPAPVTLRFTGKIHARFSTQAE